VDRDRPIHTSLFSIVGLYNAGPFGGPCASGFSVALGTQEIIGTRTLDARSGGGHDGRFENVAPGFQ
jgi:hypothetical protein